MSAARADALRALERLSEDHAAVAAAPEAVVSLQDAANQLGVTERVLARGQRSAPAEVPPPIADPDERSPHRDDLPWSGQALAVMALAESSVPYGSGPAGEVDNWLRALRREAEGKVGQALGELGFPDEELTARAEPVTSPRRLQAVEAVRARATELARRRRAAAVTTTDLLFAVLAEYQSPLVHQALYERGITEQALVARLAAASPVSSGPSQG